VRGSVSGWRGGGWGGERERENGLKSERAGERESERRERGWVGGREGERESVSARCSIDYVQRLKS